MMNHFNNKITKFLTFQDQVVKDWQEKHKVLSLTLQSYSFKSEHIVFNLKVDGRDVNLEGPTVTKLKKDYLQNSHKANREYINNLFELLIITLNLA